MVVIRVGPQPPPPQMKIKNEISSHKCSNTINIPIIISFHVEFQNKRISFHISFLTGVNCFYVLWTHDEKYIFLKQRFHTKYKSFIRP